MRQVRCALLKFIVEYFSSFLSFEHGRAKGEGKGGVGESWRLKVRQAAPVLDDGLSKLPEDSVHVGASARPQALQEANMAAMTCDQKSQVWVLLHCLHWNGCGNASKASVFIKKTRHSN